MKLPARSIERLKGVHSDLRAIVHEAASVTPVDFIVTEGMRTLARQKQLMAAGATRTMNSRHLSGHAVDLAAMVDGEIRWDWPLYSRLATAMKQAASTLNLPIEWGGDWRTFRDGPHFQLPWEAYP